MKSFLKIADALDAATRMGTDTDDPEGSRYIQISDTMATGLAKILRETADLVQMIVKKEG